MYKNAVVMNTHSTCTCILLHHYTGRTTSEYCEEFLSSTAMDTLKRAGLDLIFCLQKVNPLMPKVELLPSSRLHPPIQYVYINLRHNTVQYSAVCRCSPSRIEAKIHTHFHVFINTCEHAAHTGINLYTVHDIISAKYACTYTQCSHDYMYVVYMPPTPSL